jgi:hypothetical protein
MKVEADQNLIVYFDGRYMPMRDARVGILTHALHYGTGVFEGLRAYWNEHSRSYSFSKPTSTTSAGYKTAVFFASMYRFPPKS